ATGRTSADCTKVFCTKFAAERQRNQKSQKFLSREIHGIVRTQGRESTNFPQVNSIVGGTEIFVWDIWDKSMRRTRKGEITAHGAKLSRFDHVEVKKPHETRVKNGRNVGHGSRNRVMQ
ncbi:hypothetical protein KI387_043654, partial [Taxus chinensis]